MVVRPECPGSRRRAPVLSWAAGGIGLAIGFVASRFLKASSEGRYETSRQARRDADAALSRDGHAPHELPEYGSW